MRAGALGALTGVSAAALAALAGCGQSHPVSPVRTSSQPVAPAPPAFRSHPQAVEPTPGAAATPEQSGASPSAVSVDGSGGTLPQPVSDAEIRRELAVSGLAARTRLASLTPGGLAVPPLSAPPVVAQVISAGNQIAHLPYRFGGGHGTFVDNAYDCSGSLSFVFAAAGLLRTTMTSGELAQWGDPGPGKWITVFANQGHTFMYVAGIRFDTVALAESGTRWSLRPANEPDLATFTVRHPPGL